MKEIYLRGMIFVPLGVQAMKFTPPDNVFLLFMLFVKFSQYNKSSGKSIFFLDSINKYSAEYLNTTDVGV